MFARLKSIFVLAVTLFASFPAYAGTTLIFPRMVFQQNRSTGIAIANPTIFAATVTFRAYKTDGTLLTGTGLQNPATTAAIPPGSQVAFLASQLFSPPGSILDSATPIPVWVEASSPISGLTGFFLDFDAAVAFLDGSDLTGFGSDLVVPFVENTGGSVTELAIVNTAAAGSAAVTAELVKADGSVLSTQTKTLAARNALQGGVASMFPGDYSQVATIRLRSDRPIACMAFISRQPDNSLVVIAAQNSTTPARTLYFPQLAQGASWATSIGLVNMTASRIVVTISAYQADGTLFPAPVVRENPVAQSIPAGGQLRADMKTLFGFGDSTLQQGWIKVEASEPAINGFVEYGAGTNRALVSAQLEAVTTAVFSHQANGAGYFTGVAVLNPGSIAANIELVSLSASSQALGKTRRVLRGKQRASLLVPQWIGAARDAVGGAIFLKSDVPVIATQLFGTDSLGALSNVPPQPLTTEFDPGANLPTLRVTPPLAVVETGKSFKFTAVTTGGATVSQWAVSGVTPGNTTVGSITNAGQYTAPGIAPGSHNLTVEALTSSGELAAAASIDVVQREALTGSLTLLTSVAYFTNLQRFFIAEQQVLSSSPSGGAKYATVTNAKISEVNVDGTVAGYLTISGETVSKMIPFKDAAGNSHLLMAGSDTGNIYKLTVGDNSKTLATIATGLSKPSSLALDPVSGDLWVSESTADRVTVIERSRFDALASAPSGREAGAPPPRLLAVSAPRGIAFDPCTGALYVASVDGSVREYLNNRERRIPVGNAPLGQILILQRQGFVSCFDAVTLFAAESGRVTQIDPRTGQVISFIDATNAVVDLGFLDRGSPFSETGEEAVIIAEGPVTPGQSRVLVVPVGGLYQEKPNEGGIFEGGYPGGYPGGSADRSYDGSASDIPGFDSEPGTEFLGASSSVVYRDRVGDAFGTSLTRQAGLYAPDISSIAAYSYGTGGVVNVTFTRPVVAASALEYNSLTGYIDFDTQRGSGQAGHSDPYNPLRLSSPETDAYIDLSNSTLTILGSTSPSGARTAAIQLPVTLSFLGNTVTVVIPSALNITNARVNVTAGNTAEVTDIAPESRFAFVYPIPTASRTVQFSAPSSNPSESAGAATVDVVLSSASSSTVTVQYYPAGGTATNGQDYRMRPGTLTFAPGETRKQISVPVIADPASESNETVFIGLREATGCVIGATNLHTMTIIDSGGSTLTVQFALSTSRGLESATSASIAVRLSQSSSATVTVDYSVIGGSATGGGVDYTLANGTLTFAPGETSKSIAFSVVSDTMDEPDETIIVVLTNPRGASLGAISNHTFTIDDDDERPTVRFAEAASSALESTTAPTIPVVLTNPASTAVTVNYAVTGGTATGGGTDYSFTAGTLTFAPGETNKSISFTVVNDALDESDETVVVTLSGASANSTLGTPSTHTFTITDNDGAPRVQFSQGSSSGNESATAPPTFTVVLSNPSTSTITVNYSVTGGTASPAGPQTAGDYTLPAGTLTFLAGELSKTFTATITSDTIDEDNETFVISLALPTNPPQPAQLGTPSSHTFTILDDDSPPTVQFSSPSSSNPESTTSPQISVTLSAVSGRTVTVNYAAVNGTALSGSDYTLTGGTLSFSPGSTFLTITPTIINDNVVESNESFDVTLSAPTNASLGGITTHTYTITNDDTINLVFATAPSVSSTTLALDDAIYFDQFTVQNTGTNPAGSFTIGFYYSADSTITTGDTLLRSYPVTGGLGSLQSIVVPNQIRIPMPAGVAVGTRYLGVIIDYGNAVNNETSETDNIWSQSISVVAPELLVSSLTINPATITLRSSTTINATIRNQGTSPANSISVAYYVQQGNPVLQATTQPSLILGPFTLAAGASLAMTQQTMTPNARATWYVFVVVDYTDVSLESNENNNLASGSVVVQ